MRIDRLVDAEKQFLSIYPDGFLDIQLEEMMKKHQFDKTVAFCQKTFSEKELQHKKNSIANITRLISRSSMVSVFEKMRFRDFMREIDDYTQFELVDAIADLIHGNEERGFNALVNVLSTYNLAKWTLVSVFLAYYNPTKDIFVKPTTAKLVLRVLEINEIQYQSRPTYAFYKRYREILKELKELVDPSLSPNNGAFSGFLRMTLQP